MRKNWLINVTKVSIHEELLWIVIKESILWRVFGYKLLQKCQFCEEHLVINSYKNISFVKSVWLQLLQKCQFCEEHLVIIFYKSVSFVNNFCLWNIVIMINGYSISFFFTKQKYDLEVRILHFIFYFFCKL
jgi:hypothetical protein